MRPCDRSGFQQGVVVVEQVQRGLTYGFRLEPSPELETLAGFSPLSLASELEACALELEDAARDLRNAALRMRGYAPPPEVLWKRRAEERRRMMRDATRRAARELDGKGGR